MTTSTADCYKRVSPGRSPNGGPCDGRPGECSVNADRPPSQRRSTNNNDGRCAACRGRPRNSSAGAVIPADKRGNGGGGQGALTVRESSKHPSSRSIIPQAGRPVEGTNPGEVSSSPVLSRRDTNQERRRKKKTGEEERKCSPAGSAARRARWRTGRTGKGVVT
ncbi:hypothetical protein HPB50_018479 [Hyalomma asiaticum]|uniref:Uncharacterized protein n=1 Tax=Hyalomma asiaticum TaxID=266040 RepID=A0ACB7TJW2_HYAAI|nr:hypothetical protein HPB50_018479 [Hyalomma asiaticum]